MLQTLAPAAVDRLMHPAHVIVMQGDRHRLAKATTERGIVPFG
ncbi:hypothetical protein [Streptomyces sp. NBC_00523]|nr:hypothetical protein [Streptomyces sp. NBC_00523]